MDKKFNIVEVVEAIARWNKAIFGITFLVFVATFVMTLPSLKIILPIYESTAVVFPANLSLLDRPYLFESQSAMNVDINQFGGGYDADRIISIAESRQVQKHIVDKFDLIVHYKIKEKKVKYPLTTTLKKLESRYKVMRNEYRGIEINVADQDSILAAEMANEIVHAVDSINKRLVMEGKYNTMKLLSQHIDDKNKEVNNLATRIAASTNEVEKRLLETKSILATEQLINYSNIYDQYKLITSDAISTLHIMERAIPAEKEENVRWLIILGATIMMFIAMVLLATIVHSFIK